MRNKIASLLLIFVLCPAIARSQSRKVYEGVVDWKLKTIGTLVLLEIDGNNAGGWIRLNKFVPIDAGTVAENVVEFRAAGNQYKIDDKKERIFYSGPDGDGDSYVTQLSPVTGHFDELTEAEQFGSGNVVTMRVDARTRRFQEDGPSLWKRQGPPFETFRRMEELLQRDITVWVASSQGSGGDIEVVEEPAGMDIPLKTPKKLKEKK